MEEAFADLRGLMALAGDMVQLAERFREALAERARAGEGAPEDAMDASMEAELISMGISSPVTKATSGALYHRELSRQVSAPCCAVITYTVPELLSISQLLSCAIAVKEESEPNHGQCGLLGWLHQDRSCVQQLTVCRAPQLADFLALRIDKAGGMMPLPDVYCLFNRARGAELISPDDLLTAAKLLTATGARLTFRQFASGVLVVQSAAHSDEKVGHISSPAVWQLVCHSHILQCPNGRGGCEDNSHNGNQPCFDIPRVCRSSS